MPVSPDQTECGGGLRVASIQLAIMAGGHLPDGTDVSAPLIGGAALSGSRHGSLATITA